MEILKYVAGNIKKRSPLFYICLFASALIFIVILHGTVFSGEITTKHGTAGQIQGIAPSYMQNFFLFVQMKKIDIRIWSILELCALLGNIYIWFYYAPIFYEKLQNLGKIFGDNEDYQKLYKDFCYWTKQWNLSVTKRNLTRKNYWIKWIYNVVWAFFFIIVVAYSSSCFSDISLSGITIIMFVLLIVSMVLLNFSSYYNCVSFVYFVMRVLNLAQENKLDYVKEFPSATYGYQELKSTADMVYIYFLLDSSLCTIAYICFLGIIPMDMTSCFYRFPRAGIIEVTFLILNGLVSWVGIALLLRTYLFRLHSSWKSSSLKAYQKEYNEIISRMKENKVRSGKKLEGQKEDITNRMERLVQDRMAMNKWEFCTSIATLAADLATAGITMDFIFKMLSLK